MKCTIYKKPNGNTEVIDMRNIKDEDAKYFEENDIDVSMEEIGNGFAVYADIGVTDEDGEPDEILVLSNGKTCEETMSKLRQECEAAIF